MSMSLPRSPDTEADNDRQSSAKCLQEFRDTHLHTRIWYLLHSLLHLIIRLPMSGASKNLVVPFCTPGLREAMLGKEGLCLTTIGL